MSIIQSLNARLNPIDPATQISDNTATHCFIGAVGTALTAAIGHKFFGSSATTTRGFLVGTAILGATAYTKKDGYLHLGGVMALAGVALITANAIEAGCFHVHLDINPADIIRAVREWTDQSARK